MRVGEAARRYDGRFSRERIRRWCERGFIEGAFKAPGGWWDIPEEGLERFVERYLMPRRRKRDERDERRRSED